MEQIPAFNVLAYPSFRPPRLYRVYVDHDALYPIRMRGAIGFADADGWRGPLGGSGVRSASPPSPSD